MATHGLFNGAALERISKSCMTFVLISDTIPVKEEECAKLRVVSSAPLIAEAITCINSGQVLFLLLLRALCCCCCSMLRAAHELLAPLRVRVLRLLSLSSSSFVSSESACGPRVMTSPVAGPRLPLPHCTLAWTVSCRARCAPWRDSRARSDSGLTVRAWQSLSGLFKILHKE